MKIWRVLRASWQEKVKRRSDVSHGADTYTPYFARWRTIRENWNVEKLNVTVAVTSHYWRINARVSPCKWLGHADPGAGSVACHDTGN